MLRVFVRACVCVCVDGGIWCGNLGLRYEDLYDPMYSMDVKEALNRLPKPIVDARNQRLKRAMDLSMKHEDLPPNLQVPSSLFFFAISAFFFFFWWRNAVLGYVYNSVLVLCNWISFRFALVAGVICCGNPNISNEFCCSYKYVCVLVFLAIQVQLCKQNCLLFQWIMML